MSCNAASRWARPPGWLDALVIVGATAAIYGQAVRHQYIAFDDSLYVTGNAQVLGGLTWGSFWWAWSNFDAANYHPITWLSYLLDIELFGANAGWMAAENAAMHAVNGWLVSRILQQLGCSRLGGLFGALAFVVHPLQVESVAWISQRKTVLAAMFGLWAVDIYLRRARASRRPISWSVMVLLSASLLSKAWFVVAPVLFLVLDYWPLRRFAAVSITGSKFRQPLAWVSAWPLFREKMPMIALVVAVSFAAILSQHASNAIATIDVVPLDLRVKNSVVSCSAYLADYFRMGGFALYYPLSDHISGAEIAGGVALLAGLSIIAVLMRRRHQELIAAWCWLLLFLLPVVGLIQVGGQARANRYMYLPMIGIIWACTRLGEKGWLALRGGLRPVLTCVVVVWIATVGIIAFRQVSLWRNTFGIVGHSIAVVGADPRLLSLLAVAHMDAGRWEAAIPLLERSLRTDTGNSAVAVNLSLAYGRVGRWQDAIALALQVVEAEPTNHAALANLAYFHHELGDEATAQKYQARLQSQAPKPGWFSAAAP